MMKANAAPKCGMVDRVETFDECLSRLAAGGGSKPKKSAKAQLERERLAIEGFPRRP